MIDSEPAETPLQPSQPGSRPAAESAEPLSLDEAIESSLQTVDQELASLEAALQAEFDGSALSDGEAANAIAEAQATAFASSEDVAAGEAQTPHPPATAFAATAVAEAAPPTPAAPGAMEPPEAAEAATQDSTAAAAFARAFEPVAQAAATESLRVIGERLKGYLFTPVRAVFWFLCILDRPFSRVGRRAKSVIGNVGVATCVVAALTWLAGEQLKGWAGAQAAAVVHTDPPTGPPSDSAQHSE
jgi:hypothetical protein